MADVTSNYFLCFCSLGVLSSLPVNSSHDACVYPDMFEGQKVFLDLRDYPCLEKLEVDIRQLGGTVEKFLSRETTCVITNRGKLGRENECGSRECSPSPKTGENSLSMPVSSGPDIEKLSCSALSRGQKLLMRSNSFKHSVKSSGTSCDPVQFAVTWNISVVNIETVIEVIKSKNVQKRLPVTDKCNNKAKHLLTRKHASRKLIGPFLKIEDVGARYRPFFAELPASPCIIFNPDEGQSIFDAAKNNSKRSSGKQRVTQIKSKRVCKTPAIQRDGGYCECCDSYYKDLKKHLCEPVHKHFAEDCGNYSSLDALMHDLPSLDAITSSLAVLNYSSLEKEVLKSDTVDELQCRSPILVCEVKKVNEACFHEQKQKDESLIDFQVQKEFHNSSQCETGQSKSIVTISELAEREVVASMPAVNATLKNDEVRSVEHLKETAVKACYEGNSSLLHDGCLETIEPDSVCHVTFENKFISRTQDANMVSDLPCEENAKDERNEDPEIEMLSCEKPALEVVKVSPLVPCNLVSIGAVSSAENSEKETSNGESCVSDDSEVISAQVDSLLAMLSADHSDCVSNFSAQDGKVPDPALSDGKTSTCNESQLCITSGADLLKLDAAAVDNSKTCNKVMKSLGIAKPQLILCCNDSQADILPDDAANLQYNGKDLKPSVSCFAFKSAEKDVADSNNETAFLNAKHIAATPDLLTGAAVAATDQLLISQVSAEKTVPVNALAISEIHPTAVDVFNQRKNLMVLEHVQRSQDSSDVLELIRVQSDEACNAFCDQYTAETSQLCCNTRNHQSSEGSSTIDEGIEAVVDKGQPCLRLYLQPMPNSVAGTLVNHSRTEIEPIAEQNRATSVTSVDSAVITDDHFELGDYCCPLKARHTQESLVPSQQNVSLSVCQPSYIEPVTICVDSAHAVRMASPTFCHGNNLTDLLDTASPISCHENNFACIAGRIDDTAEDDDAAEVTNTTLTKFGVLNFSDEGSFRGENKSHESNANQIAYASGNEMIIDEQEVVSSVTNMELEDEPRVVSDITTHLQAPVTQSCDSKSEIDGEFPLKKMETMKPTDDASAIDDRSHSADESANYVHQDSNDNLMPVSDAADVLSEVQVAATTTCYREFGCTVNAESPYSGSVGQKDQQFDACLSSLSATVKEAVGDPEACLFTDSEQMDLSVETRTPGVGAELDVSVHSPAVQMQCSSDLDCNRSDIDCVTSSFMATAYDECDEMIVDPAVIVSPRIMSTPRIEDCEMHSQPVVCVPQQSHVTAVAAAGDGEQLKLEAVLLEEVFTLSEKYDATIPVTSTPAVNGTKSCVKHNAEKQMVKSAGSQGIATNARDIIQELETLELLAARLVAESTAGHSEHELCDGLKSTLPDNSLHDTLLTLADQPSLCDDGTSRLRSMVAC
jgi:hypothetical protein